jgi:hypothetical protein
MRWQEAIGMLPYLMPINFTEATITAAEKQKASNKS